MLIAAVASYENSGHPIQAHLMLRELGWWPDETNLSFMNEIPLVPFDGEQTTWSVDR